MKKGDTIEAEVVEVRDNGLYLRAEGVKGFINALELGWAPSRGPVNPADFAKVGETIAVEVYAVTEHDGFYASLKALDPSGDPFRDLSIYRLGRRHWGSVWSIASYGVFVLLESGAIAYIPNSSLGEGGHADASARPLEPLTLEERVEVEIVSFDAAWTSKLEARLWRDPETTRPPVSAGARNDVPASPREPR